jgi:hypothetical protein
VAFNTIKKIDFISSHEFLLTTSIVKNYSFYSTNFFISSNYLLSPVSKINNNKELHKVSTNLTNTNSQYYYKNIDLYFILFLNFNNSIRSVPPKLYSLYPINSSYFVNVSVFFPTLDNVLKFTKIIFFNFKVKKKQTLLLPSDLRSSVIYPQHSNFRTSLSLPLSIFSSNIFTKFKFAPTPIVLIRRFNCQS